MDKKKKTCCFTGSRSCSLSFSYVYDVVLNLIEEGFCFFGAGGAIGFDTLVAKGVIKAKEAHPHIKLILVLPFPEQPKLFTSAQKKEYFELIKKADKIVYIDNKYSNDAYLRRNRHLVTCSSLCVAFCPRCSGGAYYTARYAYAVGVPVRFV